MSKRYILMLVPAFALAFTLFILINNNQERGPIYLLEETYIQDVLFRKEDIILVSDEHNYFIDLKTYQIESIPKPSKRTLVGTFNEEIIFCKWENWTIFSPEEIASRIEILNGNGQILERIETNKSVRPHRCSLTNPIFIDNYPNSQERRYVLRNDILVEFKEESQVCEDPEGTFDRDMYTEIYCNEKQDLYILIDRYNGIWILKR